MTDNQPTEETHSGPDCDGANRLHETVSRRESLKLGGAALAAATGTSAFSGSAAAASYDEIVLDQGETLQIDLNNGDGSSYTDKLIDASAEDAEFQVNASGGDWEIRNIGVIGPLPSSIPHIFRLRVTDPDATGVLESVYVEDVVNNFMFAHPDHAGHIDIRNSTFINNLRDREDILYGSPPSNPEASWGKETGNGGTIHIYGCYGKDIGGYGWRLGADGSRIENCVLEDQNVALANLYRKRDADGDGVLMKNVDIVNANTGIRLNSHIHNDLDIPTTRTTFENVRVDADTPVQRNEHNGAEPIVTGSVDSNPDPTPPADAPMSAKEAASGTGSGGGTSTIEVFDRSASGTTSTYEFAVDGDLSATSSVNSNDEIDSNVAMGQVNGGSDAYETDAELLYFRYDGDVELQRDGSTVDLSTVPEYPRTIALDGDDSGEKAYDVTASVGIAPSAKDGASVPGSVDYSNGGRTASNSVWGGTDAYAYAGAITDLNVDLSAVEVRIDGEVVDDARWGTLDHELSVDGSNVDSASSYEITIDGPVRGMASVNANDGVYGSTVQGTVNGGSDEYRFSGTLTDVSVADGVEVLVDGEPYEPQEVTLDAHQYGFDESWHSQSVSGDFDAPVTVAKPLSFNGGQPAHTRLRNVSGGGYEAMVEEWEYLDGGHIEETVSGLVLDAGSETTASGAAIEAGTLTVDETMNWQSVSFGVDFGSAPVVISQSQTVNGGQAIVTRNQAVSRSGFETTIQEEGAEGGHVQETLGYLAVEQGTGTVDGAAFEADTVSAVDEDWTTISFEQSYDQPRFLADAQTTNGADTAALRYRNLTADSVEVFVEEEQSADDETDHIGETVGYVVIEDN